MQRRSRVLGWSDDAVGLGDGELWDMSNAEKLNLNLNLPLDEMT